MSPTVGLPRLFRHHEYPGLWEDFFRILTVDVVFSPPTDKTLFNTGIKRSSADACLPLKVLHGHVESLQDQADAVFIPRFIYPTAIESACPKFCALPDILRLNLPHAAIWETPIDFKKGMAYTLSSLDSLAMALSRNPETVRTAFLQALTGTVHCTPYVQPKKPDNKQAIALIGHTYLTQDNFVTMNLRTKIAKYGYEVLDSQSVPYDLKRQRCHPFQNRLFWGVGVDILGTALTLMNTPRVKGLIYVTSFACGIDSIVLELLDRQTQTTLPAKPRMRLCLDEHTGESGFDTRLEAFFDLLERGIGAVTQPSPAEHHSPSPHTAIQERSFL
ncbi:MAG: acyl-CoA dehydratase activase-related protein [Peptococcaceae bacterium]|nr:acyl-CoA dehydratase activase-related protein [Peptococcaceae bacterium]